ncbi:hypothetical protein D3C72_1156210 [compost metagenome]
MLRLQEHLEELFALEIQTYRIGIRMKRFMVNHAFATSLGPHGFILSIRGTLTTSEAVEAAGMEIARIALGHDFKRSGYREEYLNRDQWVSAARWLGRRLIPDSWMSRAKRKEWDKYELAELMGISVRLVEYRWADWMSQRGQLVTFPRFTRGDVERAIEATEADFWCAMPEENREVKSNISDFFYP